MGVSVCICARDAAKLDAARSEIEKNAGKCLAVVADVSHAADVDSLARKVQEALGPVEILVNNAGIGIFGPTHEAAEENWDKVWTPI